MKSSQLTLLAHCHSTTILISYWIDTIQPKIKIYDRNFSHASSSYVHRWIQDSRQPLVDISEIVTEKSEKTLSFAPGQLVHVSKPSLVTSSARDAVEVVTKTYENLKSYVQNNETLPNHQGR